MFRLSIRELPRWSANANLAAFVFGAALSFAEPAEAISTITVKDSGTSIGTVVCDPACEGFTAGGSPNAPTSAGTLSSTTADVYHLANYNETSLANALNTLANESFTKFDVTKVDTGGVGSFDFTTTFKYFILKTGAGASFFLNTNLTSLDVAYDQFYGVGGGLSFYATVVPVPAALPLLLTALCSLVWVGGRRRRVLAEI